MTPAREPNPAVRVAGTMLRLASTAGDYIAVTGVVVIMFATCADVFRRTLTGRSVPGVVEGSEVMLVIAVFLGLGYAQREKVHVATSVVTDRLPDAVSRTVRIAGILVAICFLLWLVYATGERAVQSTRTGEYRFGLLQVPIWPGRVAITVGLALLTAELVRDLWGTVTSRRRPHTEDASSRDDEDLSRVEGAL